MFWQFRNGVPDRFNPMMVYKRSDQSMSVSHNARSSSRPILIEVFPSGEAIHSGMRQFDPESQGQWVKVSFREVPLELRWRAMGCPTFGAKRTRVLAEAGPMSNFSRSQFGGARTNWRGTNINRAGYFKELRKYYRAMDPLIRAALEAQKDGGFREERDTLQDCITWANDLPYNNERTRFVDALARAFETNGFTSPVKMANCDHAEHEDDWVHDHRGSSYCEECSNDLRAIDGDYYNEDECWYWESDGEYHTCEEPEDEDEDEDREEPYSGHVKSWGQDCGNSVSHDKSFAQTPHSDFTMGVELEVECEENSSYSDAVSECNSHFNYRERYAMFKKDGSLSNRGFEIVTAARRLPEHIKKFSEWKPHEDLRAWKPGNCGVHVHIDSRAFSALTLGKFLMFINADQNTAFITAIAGRHPRNDSGARSFCAQLHQEHLADPLKAVKGDNASRYRMVNVSNLSHTEQERLQTSNVSRDCKGDYSTVELRIFRASLKKERLLAQIEFTHAAVMFCRTASWHGLSGDDFKAWLATGAALQYKNLARWYGVRVPKADKRKEIAEPVEECEMA